MSIITANNLSVGYEGQAVLSNISFTIKEGDYYCIVGENGSGKSTLMKTILGLQSPIKGSIEYGDDLKNNQIGYLPQQSDVQRDFPASVYEIVLSGCQSSLGKKFFYSKEQKKLVDENLEKMSITNLKKRCYRELSGGQQQRVLLARALCATKKVLLLDEPVTGLDAIVTEDLYKLIQKLNEEGMTIIMISHDMESVKKYASKILNVSNFSASEV